MIDLLQITDTLTQLTKSAAGDTNHDGSLSFFELLQMGGWIMIPLGIMLLLAVWVFAERTIAIRNAAKIDSNNDRPFARRNVARFALEPFVDRQQ